MQVQDAFRSITRTLGGKTTAPDEQLSILNDCGEWFYGIHAWNFAIRAAFIDVRAQISIATADWTASTKTITKTGAFANYTFLAGDQIEITVGGTPGWYEIATRTSDDAITLVSSLSSTNISAGVSGTLRLWGCALPDDIAGLLPGTPTMAPGFAQSFDIVDLAKIMEWRALFTGGSTAAYIGALSFGRPIAGGPRVPRLEIAPEIVAGQKSAFCLMYRSKWRRVTTASTEIDLPVWAEPAFREAIRHFARGYFEEDVATLDQRLANYMQGALFRQAVEQDAAIQNTWGEIEGGAVRVSSSRGPFNNFDISDPT